MSIRQWKKMYCIENVYDKMIFLYILLCNIGIEALDICDFTGEFLAHF